MLELIFQGFLEWTYGLVLEAWEFFSSVLLDLMSLDFAYLRTRMPIIDTIMEIMLAVGWALLIGNLVFQAAKGMMSGLGFEAEDPKLLFTRTFVFSFLLLASPQICKIGLDMTSTIIALMEMPDAVDITFADEASFVGLQGAWLLVMICGVIVMFQTFKLIMEMAERYFVLAVLTIMAPVAFGVGGSRNTSDIFTGWCRMFGSMCLLMVTNVVFMKMLLSVLSFYPSGLDVLPWMVLVVTIVKVAKKADSILSRIGLNPAMTGDSLGTGLPGALAFTVVRSLVSNVAGTIARNGRNGSQGARGSTPNNPRPGTPASPGKSGPVSGGGQTNTTQASANTISTQGADQTQVSQQENQSSTNQSSAASYASSQAKQPAQAGRNSSRNTSVQQGSRRGSSHVTVPKPAAAPSAVPVMGAAALAGAAAGAVMGGTAIQGGTAFAAHTSQQVQQPASQQRFAEYDPVNNKERAATETRSTLQPHTPTGPTGTVQNAVAGRHTQGQTPSVAPDRPSFSAKQPRSSNRPTDTAEQTTVQKQTVGATPAGTPQPGVAVGGKGPTTPSTAKQENRSSQRTPVSQTTPTTVSAGTQVHGGAAHVQQSASQNQQNKINTSVEQSRQPAPAAPASVPISQGERSSRNPAAVPTAASQPLPVPAPERQSRNPAPGQAATVPKAAPASRPAQQESQRPRPAPMAQKEPGFRPAMAGMGPAVPQSIPGIEPASPQQKQAQPAQKPFVPLTGKQPRSIPSHLELRQEAQKSTKRPAAEEVSHDGAE